MGEAELLDEMLLALASTGGAAVVAAVGTDAWAGTKTAVARWFGRIRPEREQRELQRLDQDAEALTTGDPDRLEETRGRLRTEWQTRFAMALEELESEARDRAVAELRALFPASAERPGVSAGDGSLVVGGDVNNRAEGGSIASGVVNGGVKVVNHPPQPEPDQG